MPPCSQESAGRAQARNAEPLIPARISAKPVECRCDRTGMVKLGDTSGGSGFESRNPERRFLPMSARKMTGMVENAVTSSNTNGGRDSPLAAFACSSQF